MVYFRLSDLVHGNQASVATVVILGWFRPRVVVGLEHVPSAELGFVQIKKCSYDLENVKIFLKTGFPKFNLIIVHFALKK